MFRGLHLLAIITGNQLNWLPYFGNIQLTKVRPTHLFLNSLLWQNKLSGDSLYLCTSDVKRRSTAKAILAILLWITGVKSPLHHSDLFLADSCWLLSPSRSRLWKDPNNIVGIHPEAWTGSWLAIPGPLLTECWELSDQQCLITQFYVQSRQGTDASTKVRIKLLLFVFFFQIPTLLF